MVAAGSDLNVPGGGWGWGWGLGGGGGGGKGGGERGGKFQWEAK